MSCVSTMCSTAASRMTSFLLCFVVLMLVGNGRAEERNTMAGGKSVTERTPATTISEQLNSPVDLLLADMDVETAVRHIGEITHTNIVIDYRALREMKQHGVRQKIDLRLKNVPLKQAMAVMLRTVGLSFAVYDHFVYISTPSRVRHESLDRMKTRMFPLKTSAARSLPKVLVLDPSTMSPSIASPAQSGFGR